MRTLALKILRDIVKKALETGHEFGLEHEETIKAYAKIDEYKKAYELLFNVKYNIDINNGVVKEVI